ncbi:BNR-4 repeat-containing protein [Aestuariibaculum suncheonense]|uniref:BNR-4 repeat-containing protein n=1 Tax=Aestuariibaculum suncheonense TaxID=1028745 RepID=A0A8J6UA36_9FLAO|nr:BNR-4 repeat-containing protein [Aestuariibaculum suncheonense]MBD0834763.1 BNR-4 repeat-containing protein [Aestuariibaculum suncheonense]
MLKIKHLLKTLFFTVYISCFSQPKPFKTAKILSNHIITQTGYCSDGTDREQNGIRRFHGPMEAKITSYNNYQYIAYYEANGDIVIARKKINAESGWEKSIIQGYQITSEDRHNKIALSISKGDGVIHIAFDHHNTPQFNYAHSKLNVATNPDNVIWDNSVFELQPNLGLRNDTGLVTYPTFFELNSTGNLIVYWRTGGSLGGEMNLANYSSTDHEWRFIGKISSQEGTYLGVNSSRGPYTAKFLDDKYGNLHISWVFRERGFAEQESKKGHYSEHGLYYAQSSDGGFTWRDNFGKVIANVKVNLVMGVDNMRQLPIEIPLDLDPRHTGLNSIIDPVTNNYITLLNHFKPNTKKKINFLYIRTPKGDWITQETNLPHQGTIKMVDDKMYVFSTAGICVSDRSTNFSEWKTIPFPIQLKKGNSNWDTSNLEKGLISMVIQYSPENYGEPSPIEIFNIKLLQ